MRIKQKVILKSAEMASQRGVGEVIIVGTKFCTVRWKNWIGQYKSWELLCVVELGWCSITCDWEDLAACESYADSLELVVGGLQRFMSLKSVGSSLAHDYASIAAHYARRILATSAEIFTCGEK